MQELLMPISSHQEKLCRSKYSVQQSWLLTSIELHETGKIVAVALKELGSQDRMVTVELETEETSELLAVLMVENWKLESMLTFMTCECSGYFLWQNDEDKTTFTITIPGDKLGDRTFRNDDMKGIQTGTMPLQYFSFVQWGTR